MLARSVVLSQGSAGGMSSSKLTWLWPETSVLCHIDVSVGNSQHGSWLPSEGEWEKERETHTEKQTEIESGSQSLFLILILLISASHYFLNILFTIKESLCPTYAQGVKGRRLHRPCIPGGRNHWRLSQRLPITGTESDGKVPFDVGPYHSLLSLRQALTRPNSQQGPE